MAKPIKYLLVGIAAVAVIAFGTMVLPGLVGYDDTPPGESPGPSIVVSTPSLTPTPDPEHEVRDVVGGFGGRLKDISLLAPVETVRESIEEYYTPYVAPALLAQWLDDPTGAPGRLVSSPWPERIDIRSVLPRSETLYEVKGEIIEVTSAEAETGGAAAKQPITLTVEQVEGKWMITDLALEGYADLNLVVYTNDAYGFRFTLPSTWEGYAIITDTWAGFAPGDDEARETGAVISIRHPAWTAEAPRQDIPIMVFTLAQWEALQAEDFHIGAAPIGPSELGRNDVYVFALPARYNYEYVTGYEEVEAILQGSPLKAIEPGPGEPEGM